MARSLADTSKGQLTTALLILAIAFLPLGLTLPALQTREVFWRTEHTIIGFAIALFESRDYALAALLAGFSVLFPAVKMGWMIRLQFWPVRETSRLRLRILETLGKWSLADVLVIALIVMTLKDSLVFGARPLPGVFLFAASTIAAMLASGRIASQLEARAAASAQSSAA